MNQNTLFLITSVFNVSMVRHDGSIHNSRYFLRND
jgi:hypothetical protein